MFVSIGLFIVDHLPDHTIGGGGTYAAIGARIWRTPASVGMIVDKGRDFPPEMLQKLLVYGDIWLFREHDGETTRAINSYRGETRIFKYITPRINLYPRDLRGTRLAQPATLHVICSPRRAIQVISEVDWDTLIIYEPIPDRCVPEELPSLVTAMASVGVLSPNAREAFGLLSITSPVTRDTVQSAARRFLDIGVGPLGKGCVVIRCDVLGACVATREMGCKWVDAFWTPRDTSKVVDVTGQYHHSRSDSRPELASRCRKQLSGGFAAGLALEHGDVYRAAFYASVSASFVIEQPGLPSLSVNPESGMEEWNEDSPQRRLETLRQRQQEY